jgi:energy-coupling factor transporter ATP-binding protein EcfA2
MITRASFRNFKSLREVDVTFDSRLTVLVGPNGSGKSSILQGIHFLTELATVSPADRDYSLAKLADFVSIGSPDKSLSLEAVGKRQSNGYQLAIDATQPGQIDGTLTSVEGEAEKTWQRTATFSGGNWHAGKSAMTPDDARLFDTSALVRFNAARLALPTVVRTYPPLITGDGTGLAATLQHIRSKYQERYEAIETAFRRVIPAVVGIRFDKGYIPDASQYGDIILVDYEATKEVKAPHVSSGTLFALGLLTVALGPDSPNVILLDDLDHGLHPKAQMELIEVFRELVNQNPELQIIATSHSPYILDRLKWNEVLVTSLNDDGSAACVPLTAHPDVKRWQDAMSPGEFWSHTGEDWVQKLRGKEVAATAP